MLLISRKEYCSTVCCYYNCGQWLFAGLPIIFTLLCTVYSKYMRKTTTWPHHGPHCLLSIAWVLWWASLSAVYCLGALMGLIVCCLLPGCLDGPHCLLSTAWVPWWASWRQRARCGCWRGRGWSCYTRWFAPPSCQLTAWTWTRDTDRGDN